MKNLIHYILLALLVLGGVTSCNQNPEDDPVPQPQITNNPVIDTTGLSITDTLNYSYSLGVIEPDSVISGYGHRTIQNTYSVSLKDFLIDDNILNESINQVFVSDKSEHPFFSIDIRYTNDDIIVDLVCSRETYQGVEPNILATLVTDTKIYKIEVKMRILPYESQAFIKGLTDSTYAKLIENGRLRYTNGNIYPLNSTAQTIHSYTFTHVYSFWPAISGPSEGTTLGSIPISENDIIDLIFQPNNKLILIANNIAYSCTIISSTSTQAFVSYQGTTFTLQY